VISGFLFHYGPRLVAAIRRIQARLVTQRSQDFVALAGLTIRTVAQGVSAWPSFNRCWLESV
jgi:hypothetical protein